MTRWLYKVSRTCAEHGRLVIILWLLAMVAIMGANRTLGGAPQNAFTLEGTDSATAQELLGQAFPGSSTEANPLVLHSSDVDFGKGAGKQTVTKVAADIRGLVSVQTVVTPSEQPTLLSADAHTAIVSVTVNDRFAGKPEVAQEILDTGTQAAGPGIEVALGGIQGQQLSKPDTSLSEALGLLAALLVLFLTMRRVVAMFIPLINAIVAVGMGLAIIGLLGRVVFIPDVAPTLGTMLGLGVGIDYALFLVTRHRKLLAQGFSVPDAVGRTAGTAGAGMVFAGGTLIAAVVGLTFTGISFLSWLGYAAAIVVALAVAASVTLVPALLGVSGQRVMPKKLSPMDDPDHDVLDNSAWGRLANAVTSRPWRFAIGSTLVLLLLAAPTLTLTLGHADSGNLPPETTARQANDLITEGFGAGTTAPLAIVVQMYSVATAPEDAKAGDGDPRAQDPRLVGLRKDLAATPGVVRVDDPVVSTDGGVAIIRTIPEWGGASPQTEDLVRDLRTDVIPPATAGQGMTAYVGGVTALTTDLSEKIAARTPSFILGVVILSFILLMLAYRSLLIPFKAAMMNLLSIAAAYGVVTAIFQWGWGASLIGLDGPVPIESYVPMMMFAVLFGLSMDYEVFLLTAFREHWERTGDMKTSVRRGLADTGRLVTAAALIMVVVFFSFVLSDNATVKMFGIGLSTAVAVDATIVRCLLVPSIMILAAKGTWWLPGWLDRLLPQVHVEGDPVALDAVASNTGSSAVGKRSLLLHRPAPVIGAAAGVVIAWALVSRLPALPLNAHTAVAMSAVLGAVAVLLPAGLGGGSTNKTVRTFGYLLGVGLGLIVIGLLSVVVPPVQADNGAITSWAIVLVSLLVVLFVGRSIALPMVLGAMATAIALGLMSPQAPGASALILATALPALITIIVTGIVASLFDRSGGSGATGREHAHDAPANDAASSTSDAGFRPPDDGIQLVRIGDPPDDPSTS
ncbi:MAG: MMPL family transporter [Candidatus Nanopelagicales bacterium]